MIKGIVPALAEGGKIKIGGLGEERQGRSGAFRLPQKFDHFVVTKTARDAAGNLIIDQELMAALPRDKDGKCREIPIVLHADDIELVFPSAYALYTGRKLACLGDGERAERFEIKDKVRTGKSKEIECPCPYLGATNGLVCKPHATLHCSIRVPGRAVAGAVYKWRTTSLISIRRIIGSLQQILNICGTLWGVPLVLRLEPVLVSPPGLQSSTVYCCHVELRETDIPAVQRQAIESARMRDAVRHSLGYRALVQPPGICETEEDEAEVQQEFHSEEVTGAERLRQRLIDQQQPTEPEPPPATQEPEVVELVDIDLLKEVGALIGQVNALNDGCGVSVIQALFQQDHLEGLGNERLMTLRDRLASVLTELQAAQVQRHEPLTPPATVSELPRASQAGGEQASLLEDGAPATKPKRRRAPAANPFA